MRKLIVWGLLMAAMVAVAEAGTLQFPTADYPDLRAAVNAAVVGDKLEQIKSGDYSDGLQIYGCGISFIGLGSALCTIHFQYLSGCSGIALGNYPLATEMRGFSLVGDQRGFSGPMICPVSGSSTRIKDVLVDCSYDGVLAGVVEGDGAVLIDHLTVVGAARGIGITAGQVEVRNSVLRDCDIGLGYYGTWGATLNNHDNLYDSCYPVYDGDATAGPGEFEGTANLNDRNVPIPVSDALNRATPDGTDLGAPQFDWPQLADLHFLVDGQRIAGSSHTFVPGDDVDISVQVVHGVPGYVNLVTYVALSVAGEYYFWPSWQQFVPSDPSTIDSSTVEFHTGDIAEVLHCTLPESGWSAPFTVDFYALGAFPGTEFTPATVLATAQFTFGV